MEEKSGKLISRLKIFFWVDLIVLLAVLFYLMYIKAPFWGDRIAQNAVFERYAIIITLACIPLALKLFHSQLKKAESLPCTDYLRVLKTQYIIRFIILDSVALFNMSGFYFLESQNLILMSVISVFALFFCYPNKAMLPVVSVNDEQKDDGHPQDESINI